MSQVCPVCQTECDNTLTKCSNASCGWEFIQLLSDSISEKTAYENKLLAAKKSYESEQKTKNEQGSNTRIKINNKRKPTKESKTLKGKIEISTSTSVEEIRDNAQSQYEKGLDFFKKAKYQEAFRFLQEASKAGLYQDAINGHSSAKNKLGIMYKLGLGIGKDINLALELFKESASQGDAEGQYNYASMVEKANLIQALKWYKESADQGNLDSLFKLGEVNYSLPQTENKKIGLSYLKMAKERGHHDADTLIKEINKKELLKVCSYISLAIVFVIAALLLRPWWNDIFNFFVGFVFLALIILIIIIALND